MKSIGVNENNIINSDHHWENESRFNLTSRRSDNSRQPTMHFVKKHRTNLPSESVKVLKQWLFKHRYQPYPNDLEKCVLAEEAQLSNIQVCNWFVNARRRILPEMLKNDGMDHERVIIRRRGRRIKSKSSNESNESLDSNDEVSNETVVESPASTNEGEEVHEELVETYCEIDGTWDYPECYEFAPANENKQESASASSGDSSGCLQLLIEAAMVVHKNDKTGS